MPKPVCVQCGANDSLLWRNQENGQICNECYLANTAGKEADAKSESEAREEEGEGAPARATGKGTRRSARATRARGPAAAGAGAAGRPGPPPGPQPARGAPARARGRRSLFKRPPLKAPTATATVVSSDSIFYKGWYMQKGDIVSVEDVEGGTYYAQVRGFLTDQYCEKSAVLTWLLPTSASPPPEKCFDPATYIIGPEEELPRRLEYMQFVMHAPSDYYRSDAAPFPLTERDLDNYSGFIWTTMEPVARA